MASARSAWGIDLGNRALKAIKLVQEAGGGYRVDDFEVIEHEQILSTAGDNRESLLTTALSNFAGRHELKKLPVAVSVSGQSSFARFIKLPPVEPKKIPEIVRFEAIQQVPFPLDDVEWSYQLFQSPESPEVEVGIFAMRKELVAKQISYLSNLGLNVQVVQMSPLAVYNTMAHDERVHGTTMFMDSGAESTDLIIADETSVWLRTLPIGGNNFTEVLAKNFKLSFAKAEELKRNAATSKYARQIFQVMRPVFADLVAEVQRSIGFYTAGHREARIAKIVALGSTFRLPGLQKYLQQNLQLNVERIDSFRAAPPSEGKMAAQFSENLVSLSTAYGLALQALGESKITSSLLPAEIRQAKLWKEKTKWFAAAAALVALGTTAGFVRYFLDSSSYHNPANAQVRESVKQDLSRAQMNSRLWMDEVQSKGQNDRDTILDIRKLKDYRDTWPIILQDEIFGLLPKDKDLKDNSLDALKKKPRADRRLVYVDSVRSTYHTDLTPLLDERTTPEERFNDLASKDSGALGFLTSPPTGGGGVASGVSGDVPTKTTPKPGEGGDSESTSSNAAAAKRGWIITIHGTTPQPYDKTVDINGERFSVGLKFLKEEYLNKLKKRDLAAAVAAKDPDQRRQHYIARVQLANVKKRELAPAVGGGDPGGPGGARPAAPGAGGAPQAPVVNPEIESVTGESMKEDTEFTIVMAVVLDPKVDTSASSDNAASAGNP